MIKKLTLLLAVALAALTANAQLQKGRILVGGSSNLSFLSSKNTSKLDGSTVQEVKTSAFEFSPEVGYFAMDNLAVGLDFTYASEKVKVDDNDWSDPTTTLGMGIFGKYYFDAGIVKPFGRANLGFLHVATSKDDEDKYNGIGLGVAAGAAFFATESIAFEASLGYEFANLKNADNDNFKNKVGVFGINIGITVVF